jgi:hypothetical protein
MTSDTNGGHGPRLFTRELRDGVRCSLCGHKAERIVTVEEPMRDLGNGIAVGDVHDYCSMNCARELWPHLVNPYEAAVARWATVKPVPVEATARRDGTTRMTWHPDPHADVVRKEWDAMQQESKRLNSNR